MDGVTLCTMGTERLNTHILYCIYTVSQSPPISIMRKVNQCATNLNGSITRLKGTIKFKERKSSQQSLKHGH